MIKARIGVSGTGVIARQLVRAINRVDDLGVSFVLTRRSPFAVDNFTPRDCLTNCLTSMIRESDVIVECSGDPVHAADVVEAAFVSGIPVVTMNTEFHVTCGSYFVGKGWLSEAEGDQPGALAALALDVRAMGFEPVVYGNMKGFLNHVPSPGDMAYWGARHSISQEQVTAFTDGTKLQMEQVLVANHHDATIVKQGMIGIEGMDRLAAARRLSHIASGLGQSVVDYVLNRDNPSGVFITATIDPVEADMLRYLKMGCGPYYYFERSYHLCGLEIIKTIRRSLRGDRPLLDNSVAPRLSVAAIAKRDLLVGDYIQRGMGSFDLRGEAVVADEVPGHIPIGIISSAILRRPVPRGGILTWDDIELPTSNAYRLTRRLFP